VPYGLVRFGVAPDHQSLKAVAKRYDKTAESAGVDFIGNVCVGRDVSVAELLEYYDAVVLAIGAPDDRKLGIPGEDLPGVIGSAAFVGWYNGHPEFADLDPPLAGTHAAVIGNGNVALDCARILSKTRGELESGDIVNHALEALDASPIRTVTILGRRGPLQISMTPRSLASSGISKPRPRSSIPPTSRLWKPTMRWSRGSASRLRCSATSQVPGPTMQSPAASSSISSPSLCGSRAMERRNGSSSSAPGSTRTTGPSAPARPMQCPQAW
jgi:hypothetical protein